MRVFLADVAHELRTPLTTVRAYADLLASDESVDPETRSRARERSRMSLDACRDSLTTCCCWHVSLRPASDQRLELMSVH